MFLSPYNPGHPEDQPKPDSHKPPSEFPKEEAPAVALAKEIQILRFVQKDNIPQLERVALPVDLVLAEELMKSAAADAKPILSLGLPAKMVFGGLYAAAKDLKIITGKKGDRKKEFAAKILKTNISNAKRWERCARCCMTFVGRPIAPSVMAHLDMLSVLPEGSRIVVFERAWTISAGKPTDLDIQSVARDLGLVVHYAPRKAAKIQSESALRVDSNGKLDVVLAAEVLDHPPIINLADAISVLDSLIVELDVSLSVKKKIERVRHCVAQNYQNVKSSGFRYWVNESSSVRTVINCMIARNFKWQARSILERKEILPGCGHYTFVKGTDAVREFSRVFSGDAFTTGDAQFKPFVVIDHAWRQAKGLPVPPNYYEHE